MAREIAHGNLAKLIGALVIGAVVVGVGTYLEPWTQEYEVKTAIAFTCSEMMKQRVEGGLDDHNREQFLSRLRRAEVRVKPENASITNKHLTGKFLCEGKVVYDTSTPWLGITALKPDIKPLKLHHVVKVKKEIADHW